MTPHPARSLLLAAVDRWASWWQGVVSPLDGTVQDRTRLDCRRSSAESTVVANVMLGQA